MASFGFLGSSFHLLLKNIISERNIRFSNTIFRFYIINYHIGMILKYTHEYMKKNSWVLSMFLVPVNELNPVPTKKFIAFKFPTLLK